MPGILVFINLSESGHEALQTATLCLTRKANDEQIDETKEHSLNMKKKNSRIRARVPNNQLHHPLSRPLIWLGQNVFIALRVLEIN